MDDAEEYLQEGCRFMEQQKWPEAARAFKNHITIVGKPSSQVYTNLGLIYASQRQLDIAVEQWLKAIEINPRDAAALFNLGMAYRDMRRLPEAITIMEKALAVSPEEPPFQRLLARLYDDSGKLEKAHELYVKVLTQDPDNHDMHNNLGVLLGKLGRLDEAIQELETAVTIKPDFGGALGNLSLGYWQKGDMTRAAHFCRLALKNGGKVPPQVQQELMGSHN
jgi:tetratricopeptide (TPR) repeat protein